ncbi:MAG: CRISPR-associated RAMP protein Csx7 [Nitrososphaeria archaeon]|nr:CRISPR-associated RAMP protein Csx7 [Nitrososphaeria archaeon]
MNNFKDLDTLKIFTKIEGIIVNETPLRIGVGRDGPIGSPIDSSVYRVNGIPMIPGSSLKGVFRTFIESIVSSKGYNVHQPWDKTVIEAEAEKNDFCIICGIFGSGELASHVKIYDSTPLENSNVNVFTKTGIAIDREFGSVKSGHLFTEEFVVPKTKWRFRMDVYNIVLFPEPEDDRGKVLRTLLDTLKSIGLSIGSRKSVGCGLIKLLEAEWKTYSIVDGVFKQKESGVLR